MARLPRLSVPAETHYVVQRGHNRQPVFLDDHDRQQFLAALRDAAAEHGLAVHAYALLADEVRLLTTPQQHDSLSKGMQALGRRYVAAFNRRHGRSGTLWEGRFRGAVIESERYFLPALTLIETAPVKAGLATEPQGWPWSSARHHLGVHRDPLITDHPLYWQLGNTPFDREAAFRRLLEAGLLPAQALALEQAGAKSWVLGSADFLTRLAQRTNRPLVPRPRGRPPRRSDDMSPIKEKNRSKTA